MDDDINDRIEKLKRDAAALGGSKMVTGFTPSCPPEVQEQFWKNVLAFENVPEVQPFDELVRAGLTLPPAEELDDVALTEALWAIIRGLEDLACVPGIHGSSERSRAVRAALVEGAS